MVWGIAFGELLCGGLWGVCCGYVGMRTRFLSINPFMLLAALFRGFCLAGRFSCGGLTGGMANGVCV